MTRLHSFKDTRAFCYANIRMDNGDPVFISVARPGDDRPLYLIALGDTETLSMQDWAMAGRVPPERRRKGVLVKKSKLGWFGQTLYDSRTVAEAAATVKALAALYPDYLVPEGMTHPALRAFTNAALHCANTAEVTTVMNTAVDGIDP